MTFISPLAQGEQHHATTRRFLAIAALGVVGLLPVAAAPRPMLAPTTRLRHSAGQSICSGVIHS